MGLPSRKTAMEKFTGECCRQLVTPSASRRRRVQGRGVAESPVAGAVLCEGAATVTSGALCGLDFFSSVFGRAPARGLLREIVIQAVGERHEIRRNHEHRGAVVLGADL